MKEKAVGGFFVVGLLVLSIFGMGLGFSGRAEDAENGSETVSYVGRCRIDGISDQNENNESHYQLEINIEGEGSTEPEEGVHEYVEGEEVTVKASPDDGWEFTGWQGDHDGGEEEITVTMDEDKEITAHFSDVVAEYELAIDIEGQGTTDPEEGTHIYEEGEEVNVEALPEEGWRFVEWVGDYEATDGEINITMDGDKNITAVFEELDVYELEISIEGQGSTVPGEGVHEYTEGEEVSVEAFPEGGWVLIEWTGDIQEDGDEITITMDDDKNITVVFEEHSYEIRDWEDLHRIRYDLGGDYTLTTDLDEETAGYDDYKTQVENHKVRESAGASTESWDKGDTINIPFDEDDYDSVLSVEDRFSSAVSYTVEHPIITIEEDTGERFIYVTYENAVVGWEPIGDRDDPFTGTFDGNWHEISDLYINRPGTNYVGLFGATYDAEITSVGLIDAEVIGYIYVGPLVGQNYQSLLQKSHANGNVSGNRDVGGLLGWNEWGGIVKNSYATSNVSGHGRVGGLVGYVRSRINNSYAAGPVEGEGWSIGGLVGEMGKGGYDALEACFWDIETTGQNESAGTGATGLTTEEMQDITTFKDADWNITSVDHEESDPEHIWNIVDNETYPFLSWQVTDEFNLTVNVEGEGTVEVDGEGIEDGETLVYENSTKVDLKAIAEKGWVFEEWTGDIDSVADPESAETTISMDNDHEITAHFREVEEDEHLLTIYVDGEGTTDPEPGTHAYIEGTEVILTAMPDEGREFVEWTGDYEETEDEITIVMDEDKKVTAVFEEIPAYELEVDIEGEGEVVVEPEQEEYEAGTEVTLTAVPDEDWHFYEWTSDAEGTEEEITIIMDDDKEVTAHFAMREYTLTVHVEGEGLVEIDPKLEQYEHGTEVNLTAIPEDGWYFKEWTGDVEGTEEEITITMDDDKEITAVFEEIQTYELTVDVEGEGEVVVEPEREDYEEGTEVTLTAVPDEGWHFVEWTGDHEGTDEQITMIIEDDMHITAVFEEEIEYYELTVNVEGEGTVEVEPDQDEYEAGTEVTLTAVPAEGWYFEEWSGDETSTEVEITVTMDENKNITAHFEKLDPGEFELSNLTVEPEEPEVGEEIEISVDVTNVGELEGEYTVEFYVNDALIDEVEVELEAGETKTVSTTYEIGEDGEYHIEAGDVSLTFTVEEVTTDSWLIAALILSIIALLVFVWMGMQSDEKTPDDPEENDEED